MESRVTITRKTLLAAVVALAMLGSIAAKLYQDSREAEALAEFCKGPSERPRLACMNSRPVDASPMPPQG